MLQWPFPGWITGGCPSQHAPHKAWDQQPSGSKAVHVKPSWVDYIPYTHILYIMYPTYIQIIAEGGDILNRLHTIM